MSFGPKKFYDIEVDRVPSGGLGPEYGYGFGVTDEQMALHDAKISHEQDMAKMQRDFAAVEKMTEKNQAWIDKQLGITRAEAPEYLKPFVDKSAAMARLRKKEAAIPLAELREKNDALLDKAAATGHVSSIESATALNEAITKSAQDVQASRAEFIAACAPAQIEAGQETQVEGTVRTDPGEKISL